MTTIKLLDELVARLRRSTERDIWLDSGLVVRPLTATAYGDSGRQIVFAIPRHRGEPASRVTVTIEVVKEAA